MYCLNWPPIDQSNKCKQILLSYKNAQQSLAKVAGAVCPEPNQLLFLLMINSKCPNFHLTLMIDFETYFFVCKRPYSGAYNICFLHK